MPRRSKTNRGHRLRALCAAALCAIAATLAVAAPPASAGPTLQPSFSVVGPSAAIVGIGGLSVARDGTGGLIFTEQNGANDNVYVSRLVGGSFQPPEEVDSGLGGSSSDPVIAAGNGGLLVVAFINGGQLYVNQAPTATTPFPAPTLLFAGAQNPAIAITQFGKAYVAFAASGDGGSDVRAAYYNAGTWGVEPTPLNVTPGDDAGTGTGRPAVAAAGDGIGIVAWGEAGRIYTRRVTGTQPSVATYQADPSSISGWNEVSADQPSIGVGGDSSYVVVGFRETVASGSTTQTRVLARRLVAGAFDPPAGADSLATPDSDSAADPVVLVGEYGRGFLIDDHVISHQLFALALGTNGFPGTVTRVDSQVNSASPDATGGIAGLFSSIIAWQEQPVLGLAEIHLSFAADGGGLGAEQVASNPLFGPTEADAGLAASGDVNGDAAVAWVQGTGPATRIVAAQLYQPPGGISLNHVDYSNAPQPTFTWSASHESWGPVTYAISINGTIAATTAATSYRPPAPLADGTYSWQVIATNQGGLTSKTGTATIHIDTLAPRVQLVISGRHTGAPVRLQLSVSDLRPGEAAGGSSGIATQLVSWGDGAGAVRVGARSSHVYTKPGLYRVSITVSDRAGNTTGVSRYIRIVPPPAAGRRRRLG